MKRVLLLVVDGCTARLLQPALDKGSLPVLAELAARGSLALNCVSIFPSITPAATASIVTGCYPAQHGIAGMSWWNPSTGDVAYYGDDVRTVLQRGAGDFLRGFLLRLNGERLQAPTLFELVERSGRRAGCFNYLIFRGDVAHEVSPPLLLKLLPSVSGPLTVHGPSWLCLGDFVSASGKRQDVDVSGGMFNRFGLDDAGTAGFLRDLPGASALPDFAVAYFADYDFDSHDEGPEDALETLRHLDGRLGEIFDDWGGLDRVLDETCIILTADHSHSDVNPEEAAGILLDEVLAGHRCADPAVGWRNGDDVMICPNMRAAEVYLREAGDATGATIAGICQEVLQDERVDQVIWRAAGDFHVATRDRGSLQFRSAADGAGAPADEYGGRWDVRGDAGALDLSIQDRQVHCGRYPNALERLAKGIDHPREGRLWITAHAGFEFRMPGQSIHPRGGSHGTLHALDSLVPLLIAGAPEQLRDGPTPRIVDAAALCAQFLGIPYDTRPGESH